MFKRILAAGMAATFCFAAALPLVAGESTIVISDPFARETPPNAQVGGVYFTIENHGASNRLVGARSDAADAVQIHTHSKGEAGIMRMRRVEGGVTLGMHEAVTFQPGGLHVMLMGLEKPLKKGESLDITLDFEDGSAIDVTVPITSISASGAEKHDHGHTHSHGGKAHTH